MPDIDTKMHLNMFRKWKERRRLLPRILGAIRREIQSKDVYGLQWGDPDVATPLKFIRDRYVLPYVNCEHRAIEIGPGGGRWTRYLLGFGKLYAVDYYSEILKALKKNFNLPNMVFIKNNGTDFPGIDANTIDYVFSFGTFVHLDTHLIEGYLENLKPILTPDASVVLQYSDKTKIMGRANKGFSENTPEKMRHMVLSKGYRIVEEDLTTLWHSSIIRFTV